MTTDSRHILVPHEFFKKSKTEYRDWRKAWVREVVQNSYDAGATRIDFRVEARGANNVEICIQDNGCGMTEHVLTNVFLCLGGSYKPDGGVGGFGYAKSIILLSHLGFAIDTLYSAVVGSGGSYEIRQSSLYQPGTRIAVTMECESVDSWVDRIREFAALSFIHAYRGCDMYVNDVLLEQDTVEYDFEYTDDSLGTCWYKLSPDTDYSVFTISMRGLPMFSEYVHNAGGSNVKGILDLGHMNSVDIFTSNRDGLTWDMGDKLRTFCSALVNSYRKTALGDSLTVVVNATTAMPSGVSGASDADADDADATDDAAPTDFLRDLDLSAYPQHWTLKLDGFVQRRNARQTAYVTQRDLVAQLQKASTLKLALRWETCVKLVLSTPWAREHGVRPVKDDLYVDIGSVEADLTDLDYLRGAICRTGFCYVPGVDALCSGTTLMLNPNVAADLKHTDHDLLDLAIHECAHLWESNHGERFASTEIELRRSFRRWVDDKTFRQYMKI